MKASFTILSLLLFSFLLRSALANTELRLSRPAIPANAELHPMAPQSQATSLSGCALHAAELKDIEDFDAQGRSDTGTVIVVQKSTRRIMLFVDGELALLNGVPVCFNVALAPAPADVGDKVVRGDHRTPEGWYRSSDKPRSQWYRPIAIHYPNAADAKRGLRSKQIDSDTYHSIVRALKRGNKPSQQTRLGGQLLIHGGGNSVDWTYGCVALDNEDLDLLRSALPDSMQVDILILP